MQQLEGQYPGDVITSIGNFNQAVLSDNVAGSQAWSSGVMRTAAINVQATLAKPWTIYGFGVQGKGWLNAGGLPISGQLGKLQAALLVGGTFTPTKQIPFSPPPNRGLPNLLTLWDGSQDPAWPLFDGVTLPAGGYFAGVFMLPQPRPLSAGDQMALAIWLTPSLTKAVETTVWTASWIVLYDY